MTATQETAFALKYFDIALGVALILTIDVKKRSLRFFILVTFFTFFKNFLFSKRFLFKNVRKVQSGKQFSKKHFQNNSNEMDL